MTKVKLSNAQLRVIHDLCVHAGAFIEASITSNGDEWIYMFARPTTDDDMLGIKNGTLVRLNNIYEINRLPYHKAQETIRCLIHKGALITELSDKEFAIQLALGTVDCRMYKLAEEYK